mmetsp:Transcript_20975/g.32520  ORF Transcript_20975/g.32520 Transcript_20975/m.32520 type:complete len:93 (+) Transcript_20975:3-281(+)
MNNKSNRPAASPAKPLTTVKVSASTSSVHKKKTASSALHSQQSSPASKKSHKSGTILASVLSGKSDGGRDLAKENIKLHSQVQEVQAENQRL